MNVELLNHFPNLKQRLLVEREEIYISICTPCYAGNVNVRFMNSVMHCIFLLSSIGIKIVFNYTDYESLVQRGRNTLSARSLADKTVTHVLFIDADIEFLPENVLKLLEHGKEIIGGIYPQKKWLFERMGNFKQILKLSKQTHNKDVSPDVFLQNNLLGYNFNGIISSIKDNLCEVDYVATGFLLISRKVFETMATVMPELKYNDDINSLNEEQRKHCYAFFDCGIVGDRYLSEDYMFCHRTKQLGYQVYCDVSLPLNHIGTCVFQGRLASVLNLEG